MPFEPHDYPANPLEKAGYVLEIHDEFDGTTLNADLWLPYYLPQWSSRERSAPRYHLHDSQLTLQIAEDQAPWCPEFDGEVRCSSLQTGAFAGALGSPHGQHRFNPLCRVREAQPNIQLYTPQFGYFEIRAKGPTTSGNLASLWMIGYEDKPEKSGEIALFELVGAHTSTEESRIRYGIHPWDDPTLTDDFHEVALPINAAQYHIYAVEWTPTHVDFFVDNVKLRTIAQSPQYPMQFMLGLYEVPTYNDWMGAPNPSDAYPKTFTVDYFRAYQPIGGW